MQHIFSSLNSNLDSLEKYGLEDEYDIRWRNIYESARHLVLLPRFNYYLYGGDLVTDLYLDRLLDYIFPLPHSDKFVLCLFLDGSIDMKLVTEYFSNYSENILMSKINNFKSCRYNSRDERLIRLCLVCIIQAVLNKIPEPFMVRNVKHEDTIAAVITSRIISDFSYWEFFTYSNPILLLELVTAQTDDSKIIRFLLEKVMLSDSNSDIIPIYLTSPLFNGRPEYLARAIDAIENVAEISNDKILEIVVCDNEWESYKIHGIFDAFSFVGANLEAVKNCACVVKNSITLW